MRISKQDALWAIEYVKFSNRHLHKDTPLAINTEISWLRGLEIFEDGIKLGLEMEGEDLVRFMRVLYNVEFVDFYQEEFWKEVREYGEKKLVKEYKQFYA